MTPDEWFNLMLDKAEAESSKAPRISDVHGSDHLMRVWQRCRILGERLGGDLDVLAAAAALHDLGRHHGFEIHGDKSAELAAPILAENQFPREKQGAVLEAVRLHDITTVPEKRTSVEARLLYDADKLDSFGVVGVARYIVFYYSKGTGVEYILNTLRKRWDGLHFKETRELARQDYDYIVDFFRRLGDAEKQG